MEWVLHERMRQLGDVESRGNISERDRTRNIRHGVHTCRSVDEKFLDDLGGELDALETRADHKYLRAALDVNTRARFVADELQCGPGLADDAASDFSAENSEL